jgi:isohexenylglutaconyl-CoA hydratase
MSHPTTPDTPLRVREHQGVLLATLNQPETRNALAPDMVQALAQVVAQAEQRAELRALVLRGSQGFFCAGGNVGNFQQRLDGSQDLGSGVAQDPVAARNREFGHFMQRLAALPLPVVAVVEGAAMGGGLGLACAADLVLATVDARFALSETSLGLIPAQIAPFVVRRIGGAATRRLGLTGERVSGPAALQLKLADELAADGPALDALLAQWLNRIGQCAPGANRSLKQLLAGLSAGPDEAGLSTWLDQASLEFSACMRNEAGEGIAAFRAKRAPSWQVRFEAETLRQLGLGELA